MNVVNSDLIQAIRGPLMLITLGVLMVLDYFQGVSFTNRTWPILLIVFGLLKLLEKSLTRVPVEPVYYPGPAPGGRPQ